MGWDLLVKRNREWVINKTISNETDRTDLWALTQSDSNPRSFVR
jgi:hypothetical protein